MTTMHSLSLVLDPQELAATSRLLAVIQDKRRRNKQIAELYDMEARVKSLGVAIPAHFQNLRHILGWPAKAVNVRANRIRLEEWRGDAAEDIERIAEDNDFASESKALTISALMHGLAFVSCTAGDPAAGEPEVLWSSYEATDASCTLNLRTRRPSFALIVNARRNDEPSELTLHLPHRIVTLHRGPAGWTRTDIPNPTGRVLVIPFIRKARIGRRFGTPVITPAITSITHAAVRSMVRAEVGDEFFSVPQRYVLGAAEDAFTEGEGWSALIGHFLAVSRNEDDTVPELGQFSQFTASGRIEITRMWATLFAGESDIPVSYLGVIQDQPSSADAIRVSENALIEDVEDDLVPLGAALRRLAELSLMVRDRTDQPPAPSDVTSVRWRDPATPTRSATTQNVVQLVQAGVLPATSRITYQHLGYDQDTITELVNDARVSAAALRLGLLTAAHQQDQTPQQ